MKYISLQKIWLFMGRDRPLFDKLFLSYYPPLTAFAYRFVKDFDTSKDIVQSVFIKIYEMKDAVLLTDDHIKSYLYKSVSNACLNHIKKESVRLGHHELHSMELAEYQFEDAVELAEEEYRIYAAIKKLPPQCQRIFVMSRFDNLKNQEIADQLVISIRTVETQVSNALRILRKTITIFFF